MGGKADRPDGIWLVRLEDGRVLAFWSRTAHPGGCVIEPARVIYPPTAGAGFRDPCLGSTFLLDGTRTFGPAPRGLDSFPSTIEDSTVKIDTSRLIIGTCGGTSHPYCSPPGAPRTERVRWPRGP
jgi:hypothetical protein